MLAMALLLPGGLLGGAGSSGAGGIDGRGKGAWTLASPPEGSLAASETEPSIGGCGSSLRHRPRSVA